MGAFIGNESKAISLEDLKAFPQFLRFGEIILDYRESRLAIEEKCQAFVLYLKSIKEAINDLKLINFYVEMNNNRPCQFTNSCQFLAHLQNSFLPICDSSRGYKFHIDFKSDKNATGNVIAQILQMIPIITISHIEFDMLGLPKTKLPVSVVTNWLHRTLEKNDQKQKDIFLEINSYFILNVQEMIDHLIKVLFLIKET